MAASPSIAGDGVGPALASALSSDQGQRRVRSLMRASQVGKCVALRLWLAAGCA